MTDTDQLVVWLREALDAAEGIAEAAAEDGTPDWHAEDHFAVADGKGEAVVYDEGRPTPDQVRHIVRHDPASVLRRIAADRKILAEHKPTKGDTWDGSKTVCDTCANASREEVEGEPYPCTTVRLLAEGWGWTEEASAQ